MFCLPTGIPVFVPSLENSVSGEVIEFTDSSEASETLDRIHSVFPDRPERSYYVKSAMSAVVGGGAETAFVYHLPISKVPKSAERIQNGDWQKYLAEHTPLPSRLNSEERRWLRHMGDTSHRTAVKLPLAVYRQLVSLSLIVDNGRRLALTPLGREVYRFVL
jgi:gamma-glutamylcyclotransferase (GGCT)/AIG2-like uncharacterized protein YtfP